MCIDEEPEVRQNSEWGAVSGADDHSSPGSGGSVASAPTLSPKSWINAHEWPERRCLGGQLCMIPPVLGPSVGRGKAPSREDGGGRNLGKDREGGDPLPGRTGKEFADCWRVCIIDPKSERVHRVHISGTPYAALQRCKPLTWSSLHPWRPDVHFLQVLTAIAGSET